MGYLFAFMAGAGITGTVALVSLEITKESRLWDCSRSGGQYVTGKGCMMETKGGALVRTKLCPLEAPND